MQELDIVLRSMGSTIALVMFGMFLVVVGLDRLYRQGKPPSVDWWVLAIISILGLFRFGIPDAYGAVSLIFAVFGYALAVKTLDDPALSMTPLDELRALILMPIAMFCIWPIYLLAAGSFLCGTLRDNTRRKTVCGHS